MTISALIKFVAALFAPLIVWMSWFWLLLFSVARSPPIDALDEFSGALRHAEEHLKHTSADYTSDYTPADY